MKWAIQSLALVCAFVAAPAQATAVEISAPQPGALVQAASALTVQATVSGAPVQVVSVEATLGSATAGLSRTTGADWAGSLSVPPSLGSAHLTVRATDAQGTTTSATIAVTVVGPPPAVTVLEPKARQVVPPCTRLRAHCGEPGCSLKATYGGQTFPSVGADLDTTVDLSGSTDDWATLSFTATDAAGQTTTGSIEVFVSGNPRLVPSADFSPHDVEAYGDGLGIVCVDGAAHIVDASSGNSVYESPFGPSYGGCDNLMQHSTIRDGRAVIATSRPSTSGGGLTVLWSPDGGQRDPDVNVYRINGDFLLLSDIGTKTMSRATFQDSFDGGAMANTIVEAALGSDGRVVLATPTDAGFTYALSTGASPAIATTTGEPRALALGGDVLVASEDDAAAQAHRTVLYALDGGVIQSASHDLFSWLVGCPADCYAGGNTCISPKTQQCKVFVRELAGAGGWVAYEKSVSGIDQVFRRGPSGVEEQVGIFDAPSAIETLAPDGELMFISGGKRYLKRASGDPELVSVALGGSIWNDGEWLVLIGSTVLRLDETATDGGAPVCNGSGSQEPPAGGGGSGCDSSAGSGAFWTAALAVVGALALRRRRRADD